MSNILRSQDRSDVLAHVAENLRRLRSELGVSQVALAERSGLSRRMIVGLETGEANISLSSLDKLAAALGVSFTDLVRSPSSEMRGFVDEVAWRGEKGASEARLLGSVTATTEAQLWLWRLVPGERYQAEPDPAGWYEMIYVIEGELTLERSGEFETYVAGKTVIFNSDQTYAYTNRGDGPLVFVRNVIS